MARTLPPPLPTVGLGVDAYGQPVIDPTANVIAIIEAAIKRQDDLREAESRHVREVAKLRAEYSMELRASEAARLDAIRKVDNEAVIRAAEVQAQQAQILASQVTTSAETLRNAAAAQTAAQTIALNAALEPIQKRIDDLTRTQYEAQGQKTQVIETRATSEDFRPILDALARLEAQRQQDVGVKAQVVEQRAVSGAFYAAAGFVVALVVALFVIAGVVLANTVGG